MVYCGKPSRGCQMCRTRRIKCDETKPTCNQCAKSRRQCPGYKDDFDLVFRNETQATERRARRAVNSKKISAQITFSNQQNAFSAELQQYDYDSQALMLPKSEMSTLYSPPDTISIPYEQQAPCFFVTNFVMQPQQASRGYFDFLEPMLEKETPDSHLSLAFAAASMASLANRPNSRGRALYAQAVGKYTKALKAVNIALQNPALQKTDQTLASILLLGFFETIASERSNAMAWYSHVDGAIQLVKMRGKKQLRTKVGASLFNYVRSQMAVSCMSGSKAPPLGVDWWLGDNRDDPTWFVTKLTLQIADLRYDINAALSTFPRTPEYFQEVQGLMRKAQAMEAEYLEWEAKVPDAWRPQTVAWVDQIPGGDITKATVCPGKVDFYQDLWTAQLWNTTRVARIFVSGVIVRCAAWVCSPVDYRTTPEYAQAVRLCGDIVTDVIASIPFFLGWNVHQVGSLSLDEVPEFDSWGSSGPAKAIGGFFAIWPLFTMTNTDFIADSQRAWAKGRMMYISETLGLNHAKVLSRFQLRLPSMIIRRDALVHTPPTTQMMAATMSKGYTPPVAANINTHITTKTINKLAASESPPQAQVQPQQAPQYQQQQYQQYQTINQIAAEQSSQSQQYQPYQQQQYIAQASYGPQPQHPFKSEPQDYTSQSQAQPNSQSQSQYTYQDPPPTLNNPSPTPFTPTQTFSATSASPIETPENIPIYTMYPLQQREAMQRETWEKERKKLLKKASNAQGDSVERLLANYLRI